MFQLTRFSHNTVFFRNQNARYAGTRCTLPLSMYFIYVQLNFSWLSYMSGCNLSMYLRRWNIAQLKDVKCSKFPPKFVGHHTRGVFRTFELRVVTVIDCPKIAGAKGL